MEALRYAGNGKFKIVKVEVPKLMAGEVLIRMKVSGICGSDLHIQKSHDSKFVKFSNFEPPYPGHEPSGIVEKIGDCVKNINIGDKVAIYHKKGCGNCNYCLEGKYNFCNKGSAISEHVNGACADYLVIEERNCLKLPKEITFEDGAVLMCAGGTAYSGLKKINVSGKDVIAIFGLGPVGLCTLIFAKALGAKIIAVDMMKERLKIAKDFGADYIISSADDSLIKKVYQVVPNVWVNTTKTVKEIYDITNGAGVSASIECSGNIQARINSIDCTKKEGCVLCLGVDFSFFQDDSYQRGLETDKIIFKEMKIYGSNVFPINMYYEMVNFIKLHSISIGKIITSKYSLSDGEKAFEEASSKKVGKVAIVW